MKTAMTDPIKKRLSDFPEYAAEKAKLDKLQQELGDAERRFQEINQQLIDCSAASDRTGTDRGGQQYVHIPPPAAGEPWMQLVHPDDLPKHARERARQAEAGQGSRVIKSPAQVRLEQAAQSLLNGQDVGLEGNNAAELREELGSVQFRMAALREAIKIQRQKLDGVVRSCAKQMGEVLRPVYLLKVRATAAALYQMAIAEAEMRDYWDAVSGEFTGISAALQPLARIGLGHIKDPNSRINQVLEDARQLGAFDDLDELQAA